MEGMRRQEEVMPGKYKNVTIVITIREFGIRTDIKEGDAIREALAKDILGWAKPATEEGIIDYFTGETIDIKAI